jgi:hypothetical protein
LLKKLPQSVLAFALPVPLRVGGVFLTDLPAIIALYVSLAAASASAGGGGGGMRGGLTIAGTFLRFGGMLELGPA